MSIVRLLLIIIAIYFAYRFIFHFFLPVYRASKRMHQQFRGMQDQMNQPMGAQPQQRQQQPDGTKTNGNASGVKKDYIDFEEIKS
jgi:hypothetical protein